MVNGKQQSRITGRPVCYGVYVSVYGSIKWHGEKQAGGMALRSASCLATPQYGCNARRVIEREEVGKQENNG